MKKEKSILEKVKNPTMKASEVLERGKIVYRGKYKDIKIFVRKGGASWCGYIGVPIVYKVPSKQVASKISYDEVDIHPHGGLTFGEQGDGEQGWTKGYYWYGWDYAHGGDYTHFSPELEGVTNKNSKKYKEMKEALDKINKILTVPFSLRGKDWNLGEVVLESYEVAEEFYLKYIIKGREKKKEIKK